MVSIIRPGCLIETFQDFHELRLLTLFRHVTLIYGLIPPMAGRNRVKTKSFIGDLYGSGDLIEQDA